jgi:hypothetical protein
MSEVCEFLTYESFDEDDIIVDFHKSYSQMWIILEGSVNFELNVKDSHFKQKDVTQFAEEYGLCGRHLFHQIEDFKEKLGISAKALLLNSLKMNLQSKIL